MCTICGEKPGEIPATLILNLDNSFDQTKVKALIPAFAAEYADCPSLPQEDIELMFIIKPLILFSAIFSIT